jgi:ferredoxin
MATLTVIDRAGHTRICAAEAGWRVMELLRDQDAGVEGLCGGACDCATCHIILAPEWAGRVPPPREEELLKLDELPWVAPTSRLSCQIIWDDALDGLTLTVAEA